MQYFHSQKGTNSLTRADGETERERETVSWSA